jgi:hypothetical protein
MSILDQVDHRPYPISAGRWIMSQEWHDVLFAHWPVAVGDLRRAVPPQLELDLHGGNAWVSVVPFMMRKVRPAGSPWLPWLSNFAELNVRTYVRYGEQTGVYFFSLDASNPVAVSTARAWFHLPYYQARMRVRRLGEEIRYRSERTHRLAPVAKLAAAYRPIGEPLVPRPGSLEHWLTERYRLITLRRDGRVLIGEIHHPAWQLQPAEAVFHHNTMTARLGLTLAGDPALLHYSARQEMVAWQPRPAENLPVS